MNTTQLAKFLGVKPQTISRWVSIGYIPPHVEGRWSDEQVEDIHYWHMNRDKKRGPEPMDKNPVKKMLLPYKMDEFWSFIYERQNIWYRRHVLKKPPPWTTNKILRDNFFTNVYRELDPATVYLKFFILENPELTPQDKLFNIIWFRFVGSQEQMFMTYGPLPMKKYNKDKVEKKLRKLDNAFGKAYNVYPNVRHRDKDKIENVAIYFDDLRSQIPGLHKSIRRAKKAEDVYDSLTDIWGLGPFLSYQTYVDLCYMDDFPFTRDDFVKAGPGAQRGINALIGTHKREGREIEIMQYLHRTQAKQFKERGFKFKWIKDEDGNKIRIWLSDIQNCLCEFSKYQRIMNTGRGNRLYRGGK